VWRRRRPCYLDPIMKFRALLGNDAGVLESGSHHVVICVFEAIGRVAELAGNYFAARP